MSKKLRILSRAITHNIEGVSTQTGTPTPSDPIDVLPLQTDSITGINISSWNLHGISTYKDIYNYSTKKITRRIKVKVLDGSEDWTYDQYYRFSIAFGDILTPGSSRAANIMSSHFVATTSASSAGEMFTYGTTTYFFPPSGISTVSAWTEWLAAQYADGTPVIVYYPISAVTETIEYVYPKCVITTSEASGKVRELVTRGKNLYNRTLEKLNYYLNPSTGQESGESSSACSPFIQCYPDTTYTISFKYMKSGYFVRLHQYIGTTWKNLIWQQPQGAGTVGDTITYTFTTASDASYIRFSYPQLDEDIQLEIGDTATSYEEWIDPTSVVLSNTAHRLISQEVSE